MPDRPDRVVDAHVHHWDPSRVSWYPFLATDDALKDLGMEDVTAMRRRFDQPTYFKEAHGWNVTKYVHVTAATAPHFLAETEELEAEASATGHPNAIIGGIDAHESLAGIVAQLDQQGRSPHFRGVRASEGMDHASALAASVLSALQDRDLIYDLVIHPGGMKEAARLLERFGQLTVVVEHTGWPLAADDAAHFALWRDGMSALAAVGDRVHCKLSGLAMTLNRFDAGAFRPWIEHCVAAFGDSRCFFASNFPVDGLFGSYDDLYSVYDEVTAGSSLASRAALFADNAERVYRC